MKMSTKGKIDLICKEGVSTQVYLDSVGVKTIGIGATVSEIPDLNKWPLDKSLTLQQVFDLFPRSLAKYEQAVNVAVKVPLEQHQFDALVSICYNIGVGGLKGSQFIKKINNGESMQSIHAAIMMWTKNKELIGRRKKEADLYTTGKYNNNGKTQLYDTGGTGHIIWNRTKTIEVADYVQHEE